MGAESIAAFPPELGAFSTDGGSAGRHLVPAEDIRPVATATSSEFNTFTVPLFPIACWRMDDIRFDFAMSFVRPEAEREMKLLGRLVKDHPGAPLSVFGHADPTGSDDFNKQLSGRRASAVYGALIRDTDIWEDLYKVPYSKDNWGLKSIQTMLAALGHSPGAIDGVDGPATQGAVRDFQTTQGLPPSGQATKATRAKLFAAYMDFLCGADFRLQKSDFLARGAGQRGKGDYQGCSEFNAILRASVEQEREFKNPEKKAERDEFHATNRRVTVFLFRPGSKVDPQRWPCPDVLDGTEKCRKRFWSDHERRRQPGPEPRHFEKTFDTFACRFYDRIAGESPCERRTRRKLLRVFVQDEQGDAIANESYTLEIDGVLVSTSADVTDGRGMVQKVIPFEAATGVLTVRHHTWNLEITDPPPHSEEAGVRTRLANLGFVNHALEPAEDELSFALWEFQHDSEIDRSGEIDDPTKQHLDKIHQIV